MGIPATGLQTVFAQQTAAALSDRQHRQLASTVRAVLSWALLIWLLMAAGVFIFRRQLIVTLQIANPAALWITVLVGLASLWLPVLLGVLQGQQNFLWLGGVPILNGLVRFVAVAIIVLLLGGAAAGAMAGALLGMIIGAGIGLWQSFAAWRGPGIQFEAANWLKRVVPLTLGAGVGMFMLSADMILVQSLFDKNETGFYAAAGMIGRALVFFTIPLTAVMFPKIVRSAARLEKTNVLGHTLGTTALLGALAALGCTWLPWLPLRIVYDASFLKIAYLVPWFVWAMLPLTLANVLISNLLAREHFHAVPWLMVVAAGYGAALCAFNHSFLMVVQMLGVFNLLLLGVSAWFTWKNKG
jgi:O-antigen/teichoic acid export membrane protein